jgi:pimeloyl-ACP methyl ester carboxylesterase
VPRALRVVAIASAIAISLAGCDTKDHRAAATSEPSVDSVGERNIAVHCGGSGSTVVVFAAGLGDSAQASWGDLPGEIEGVRWCAFDRPGTGSTPAAPDRTIESDVDDLAAVVDEVEQSAERVVLVGHSLGGLVARTVTYEHPDEVDGLVLVDATPAGWGARLAAASPVLDAVVSGGNPEHIDLRVDPVAADRLNAAGSLGDVPIRSLISSQASEYPGVDESDQQRLESFRVAVQQGVLERASSQSSVEIVDCGHYIQRERPDTVIESIRAMVSDVEGAAK